MGLLNRWSKKNEKEQLDAAQKAQSDVAVDETPKKDEKAVAPKTEQKKTTEKKAQAPKKAFAEALIRPVVSEKAAQNEGRGVYTFLIKPEATKVEVKQAVKQTYGVVPTKVRVMNMEGKRVRFGRRRGRRSDWKKAIVTLPKGRTISIHEGV